MAFVPHLIPGQPGQTSNPLGHSNPVNGPHNNFGFPKGYFQIRSVNTGNVLTVGSWLTLDGATLCIWLNAGHESQVFFVDHTGVLCCKAGGNAVDAVNYTIVVRHHHPVTTPWPNPWSHPLPQFTFTATTGWIRVTFSCDPSLSPNWPQHEQEWRGREFVLAIHSSHSFRTRAHSEFSRWAPTSCFAALSTAGTGITGGGNEHYVLIEDHALDASSTRRKMWEFIGV